MVVLFPNLAAVFGMVRASLWLDSKEVERRSKGNPAAQDTAWDLITTNFETVVERMPEIRQPKLAGLTGYFCSVRKAADAEDFFQQNAQLIPGYERSLAQGTEKATLCSALRAQKALDVNNFFQQ